MESRRNLSLVNKFQLIEIKARGLNNNKFFIALLVSVLLAGVLSSSHAISLQTNSISIKSTGQISILNIYAKSGSAKDIQTAVDQVVAAGGIGNVYVPEGTFNFVEVGEPWTTVNIPAGVNLFGAPTRRTSGLSEPSRGMSPNDQVVEWKTTLVMPYDVGSTPVSWFYILGDGDAAKPSRISDIKFVGYRSFDPKALARNQAMRVFSVFDFRIDHCYLEHVTDGIRVDAGSPSYVGWGPPSRGVIDHSYLVNIHAHVEGEMAKCTVGYGISLSRSYGDVWEDDVSKVLGKYTDYTVFIEDCYLEKWRHVTAANSGSHYVIRHSTVKDDFGFGSIDSHGWLQTRCDNTQHGTIANPTAVYDEEEETWVCGVEVIGNPGDICGEPLTSSGTFRITQVGTRATEIYNCEILDAIQNSAATFIRGGSGVAFNNIVGGGTYTSFMYLSNEARPEGSKVWSQDWWIWNNTMLPGCTEIIKNDPNNQIIEGEHYFRHAPHTFNYEPYPYPHPLTIK